jgi:predicted RNase H-like nuclease
MQMGFMLHRKLHAMDYAFFPTEGKLRQVLEVYPYAAYAVLLGVLPLPKHSLEGRLQRQLALYEEKVRISDPMDFFEEITRHRLLRGILPLDDLHTPAELDALVAAYTAWKAALHPEKILLIGDAQEGQVVLPVSELKPKFESLGGIRTG